jgi:uncharacterized protein YdcH (DUF465 family)
LGKDGGFGAAFQMVKTFLKFSLARRVKAGKLGTSSGHANKKQFKDRQPSTGGIPMDIHHPFVSEFPEHRETIRHLRLSDNRFRQMFEEYHQLDDSICRFEEEIEFATDQEIDELKFKRAKLKDALYTAVSRAVPVAP